MKAGENRGLRAANSADERVLRAACDPVRFTGAISSLSDADRVLLLDRSTSSDDGVRVRTAALIERVRRDGDDALRAMAREYDGVELEALEVPPSRWASALDAVDPSLRSAMERSLANITTAHRAFLPEPIEVRTEAGIVVGRRPDPLSRVGVYAPGGRAAYPSSVLMGAAPARVAGVPEVILCSPPLRASGQPSPAVLAAAALAGVDRVFAIGGAGAIAAMAYGTRSVPQVDRVVGPGNAYVAEAKLQLAGMVATDSPAGPSELLVIADATTEPALVAREMLAQAEHDPRACVVAVIIGEGLAAILAEWLAALVREQPRAAIIAEALAGRGGILTAATLDEALDFANTFAPEHLLLAIADADDALARVRNAGTVLVGASSSVTFGDYMTGANHVLPTGGLARTYSGLSTLHFVRWTSWQRVEPAFATRLADDVATFADAESLPAHAAAARAWAGEESLR